MRFLLPIFDVGDELSVLLKSDPDACMIIVSNIETEKNNFFTKSLYVVTGFLYITVTESQKACNYYPEIQTARSKIA